METAEPKPGGLGCDEFHFLFKGSNAGKHKLELSGFSYEKGINETVVDRIEDYIVEIEIPITPQLRKVRQGRCPVRCGCIPAVP